MLACVCAHAASAVLCKSCVCLSPGLMDLLPALGKACVHWIWQNCLGHALLCCSWQKPVSSWSFFSMAGWPPLRTSQWLTAKSEQLSSLQILLLKYIAGCTDSEPFAAGILVACWTLQGS